MTHFRLDVTITSITSITSGFWPDVTLDGSLPGAHPNLSKQAIAMHLSAWSLGQACMARLSLSASACAHSLSQWLQARARRQPEDVRVEGSQPGPQPAMR